MKHQMKQAGEDKGRMHITDIMFRRGWIQDGDQMKQAGEDKCSVRITGFITKRCARTHTSAGFALQLVKKIGLQWHAFRVGSSECN